MFRMTSVLFAAALLAQPAEAGVMYTWHQTAASDSMPAGLNLELMFSEAAVREGSLKLDIFASCEYGGSCYDGQRSLLSLRYWFDADNGAAGPDRFNYIRYGYRSKPQYWGDTISLDLNFLPNGMLSGSLAANDGVSDFAMVSDGTSFMVTRAASDEGPCTYDIAQCSGELGELRAQVPEPSSAAIAGLGLLAAWFGRRRRR